MAAIDQMPAIFLAHGSPFTLVDQAWMGELHAWARAMPTPRAVLMLSAHWEASPVTLGATTTVPLIYDFYGFPPSFYAWKYPAPGAPWLAERVRALLSATQPVVDDPARGLDHGAWVPLVAMYPAHDVPVLQLSLPTEDPRALLALGRALAPLRKEGVLIVGSGFLTHNLRELDRRPEAPPVGWAVEFDAWVRDAIERKDLDALVAYRERAPAVERALPTREHFVPLFVSMGAAMDAADPVRFPITGIIAGTLTKRSVQLG